MKSIAYILMVFVAVSPVGAVDDAWWLRSISAWTAIEDGFETISDPFSSRQVQFNANRNMREVAERAINSSQTTIVSNQTVPAKIAFESAMLNIVLGSDHAEASLLCGDNYTCVYEQVSVAQGYATNYTWDMLEFALLYKERENEATIPDQISNQSLCRPANGSAAC